MSPSWDPAVPQAMQQHGGRNRPLPLESMNQEVQPADGTTPKGTSLQVVSSQTVSSGAEAATRRPLAQQQD